MPISSIVAVAVTVAQKKKESLLRGLSKEKKRKGVKGNTKGKTDKKSIRNVNYEPYINNPLGNDIK